MVSLTAQMPAITGLLKRLARETNRDVRDVLKSTARTFAVDLAFATQPYGKSPSVRKKGVGAIGRDIGGREGMVAPLNKNLMNGATTKSGMKKLFVKNKTLYVTPLASFNMSTDALKSVHRRMFKNGKMSKPLALQKKTANYSVIQKPVTARETASRLAKHYSKRVGSAKAGWGACALALGGTRGLPAWVIKNITSGAGSSQLVEAGGALTYILTNNRRHATNNLSKQQKRNVQKSTISKLEKQLNVVMRRKGL